MNYTQARRRKYPLQWMTGTALMMAVTLLMASTPLGFITTPFLSATTMHIPVIIATLALGWESGVLTGLIFGVQSWINSFSSASFFAPFFINPLVSVLPRVLFPLCVFVIDRAVRKLTGKCRKSREISCIAASALGTALHTTMVMGMIGLLDGQKIAERLVSGMGMPEAIAQHGVGAGLAVMGVTNGVPEMIVAAVIAPIVVLALDKALGRMTVRR